MDDPDLQSRCFERSRLVNSANEHNNRAKARVRANELIQHGSLTCHTRFQNPAQTLTSSFPPASYLSPPSVTFLSLSRKTQTLTQVTLISVLFLLLPDLSSSTFHWFDLFSNQFLQWKEETRRRLRPLKPTAGKNSSSFRWFYLDLGVFVSFLSISFRFRCFHRLSLSLSVLLGFLWRRKEARSRVRNLRGRRRLRRIRTSRRGLRVLSSSSCNSIFTSSVCVNFILFCSVCVWHLSDVSFVFDRREEFRTQFKKENPSNKSVAAVRPF